MIIRNLLNFNLKTIISTVLGFCLALPAQAQSVLEEIVVTAQYREESLQEVPVAVTAFSSVEVLRAGIESTQDFINLTPNVTLDDSFTLGNTFVQVRGVAQINNADSPVAIVIDGVPQNNQKQFKQELYDIERIEVLKGPQGSLYGRNAIGGAINIVTKAPTNELEGYVRAGYGNGDMKKVAGALSGAIIDDTLLFRVSGAYKDFDGLVNNNFLDRKVDFYEKRDIRGKLIWNATDTISAELRVSYSDADGGCCSDTFLFNPLVGNLTPNLAGTPNPNNNTYNEPRMNVLGQTDKLENFEVTAKLNWMLPNDIEATYIFNHTDVNENYFADLDFTDGVDQSLGALTTFLLGFPVAVGQQQLLDVELMSHELRLASPSDQRLRWIIGAYYLQTERGLNTIAPLDFNPTTPVFDRDGLAFFAPLVSIQEENDNDAYALFGQVEYDIFDDLELSLGLRYDYDKRRHNGVFPLQTAPRKSFSDLQPRAVLTKRWNDDMLTYASYSRGFRSGGFNGPAIGSLAFDEETLDNFEIGLKSDWMDGRLRFNAAFFYAQSDDFQFFFVDLITASQIIANIEEVEMMGAELEVQALLTDDWSIYGTLGITDTEIEESLARPQDEGNRTPKNQKYSLNVGTQYVQEFGGVTGRFRLDYEHRGRKYWHPDNNNSMDPFGMINARLSMEWDNFIVTAWGKNLGDTSFWQDYNAALFSGAFGDIGFLNTGRTYGVDVQYNFGGN